MLQILERLRLALAEQAIFRSGGWHIGISGIDGIIPTNGADGDSAPLQPMLEGIATYGTKLIEIPYTKLQVAALNTDIEVFSLPGNYEFLRGIMRMQNLFTGVGGCRLALGISGDSNSLQKYVPLFDAAVESQGYGNTADIPSITSTPTSIRLYADADANLSGLTGGLVRICLRFQKLPF